MDQNKNQGQEGQDQPGQGSTTPAERGTGTQGERNRGSEMDRSSGRRDRSSGITNRPMDEELSEQEELPDRGSER